MNMQLRHNISDAREIYLWTAEVILYESGDLSGFAHYQITFRRGELEQIRPVSLRH
jgi:hypothetical protein